MALPDPAITATLKTEEQCISYLEQLRWPDGVACPNCGNRKISRFHAKGKSGKVRQICQCLDRDCKYQFSATTGTIFHDSHLPLSKWYEAMRLCADASAPTSINQLRFALDVQYKTARNVAERIQQALAAGTIELNGAPAAPQPARTSAAPAAPPAKKRAPVRKPVEVPSRTPKPTPARPRVPVRVPAQPPASQTPAGQVPPTVVDSMLSVFTSAMNLSVKPPLAAVKYLKKKILD